MSVAITTTLLVGKLTLENCFTSLYYSPLQITHTFLICLMTVNDSQQERHNSTPKVDH